MTISNMQTGRPKRIQWMDNLKSIIILIVVLYHVGGVYEGAGLWAGFWIVDDPDTLTWVGILGIAFDIFIMSTMFFISGYLAPASLRTKTVWIFIKRKLLRLIGPWILAVLTLIPLYKFFFLYSRGLPQEHWTSYFHFGAASTTAQNWLWFLPVLFAFNLIYSLIALIKVKIPKISITGAIVSAILIGVLYSLFVGGFTGFRSWTHTILFHFENERFLMHFMAFLVGTLCQHQGVFDSKPRGRKLYIAVNAIAWIPVTAHIFTRLYPFFYPEGFSFTVVYRLIWWISFYISLAFMLYLMVETFRRYFDKSGRVWNIINSNSYGVYIIHVVVIGFFGTLLLSLPLSPLMKYPLLFFLTYIISNFVVSGYRAVARKNHAGNSSGI
jgi:fucose 4-O-acetylase-like acetyltransferase